MTTDLLPWLREVLEGHTTHETINALTRGIFTACSCGFLGDGRSIDHVAEVLNTRLAGIVEKAERLAFLIDQPGEGWIDWSARSRSGDPSLHPESYYTLTETSAVWVKEFRAALAALSGDPNNPTMKGTTNE